MSCSVQANAATLRDWTEVIPFVSRDSQASQCMQCLLSPNDATGHQNFTLNLVKALNITVSFSCHVILSLFLLCVYNLRFESRPLPSFGHLHVAILHHSILSRPSYRENREYNLVGREDVDEDRSGSG